MAGLAVLCCFPIQDNQGPECLISLDGSRVGGRKRQVVVDSIAFPPFPKKPEVSPRKPFFSWFSLVEMKQSRLNTKKLS